MDKIEKQKVQSFLINLDLKIKEVKDFLTLADGDLLLEEIAKFEEENGEFLQFNSAYQDELNRRKWIIQFILFPVISDDKVEELLQYHVLEAIDVGLDIDELMKMRAITISELLWPKVSQQYLKSISQNTQLIGSEPLIVEGGKNSYLPYVKNWISVYNRRFGIEKHSGLEPHQFVLEDPNAGRLSKGLKEKLLKILKFYESLKVYSLSEIEGELRKMQMGAVAQQAVAYSISKSGPPGSEQKPAPGAATRLSVPAPTAVAAAGSSSAAAKSVPRDILVDKRIKFTGAKYSTEKDSPKITPTLEIETPKEEKKLPLESQEIERLAKREVVEKSVAELIEKYPSLINYKITSKSISLPTAPFSLTPSIQNWIDFYHKECGKGKHTPQERDNFLEQLKKNQGVGPADAQKLQKLFRSLDDKSPLPYDKTNKELLLDLVKVGEKLKSEEEISEKESIAKELDKIIKKSPTRVIKKSPEAAKKDEGYLDIELVPGVVSDNKTMKQ